MAKIENQIALHSTGGHVITKTNDEILLGLGLDVVSAKGWKIVVRGDEVIAQLKAKELRQWLVRSEQATMY